MRRDRQRPHPQAVFLEDHYGAAFQRVGEGGQVRDQQRRLTLRPAVDAAPEQDHRRPVRLSQRQESGEVRVRGDDDPVLGGGAVEDLRVAAPLPAEVADMDRVVTVPLAVPQPVRARGSVRSRTASAA